MLFMKRAGKPNTSIWGTVAVLFMAYTCVYLLGTSVYDSILSYLGIAPTVQEETLNWDDMEKEITSSAGSGAEFNRNGSGEISSAKHILAWKTPIYDDQNAQHQMLKLLAETEAMNQLRSFNIANMDEVTLNTKLLACIEDFFSKDLNMPESLSEDERLFLETKLFKTHKSLCAEQYGFYFYPKSAN